jgi:molybdenum cofactor cytidylyltransferase
MGANTEAPSPVAAIVLAAGASTRMGRPKQLLPVGGQAMVRRVTEAVCQAGLDQVVVVVGAYAEAVTQALLGLEVDIVVNEAWAEGMSRSLRVGLRALRPEIGAALIILADQPALTPDLLKKLVDHYGTTGAPIVAPFYRGQRGNPVLFGRQFFPELMALEGDQGGRALVARYAEQVASLHVDDLATLLDVDTDQDHERANDLLQQQNHWTNHR